MKELATRSATAAAFCDDAQLMQRFSVFRGSCRLRDCRWTSNDGRRSAGITAQWHQTDRGTSRVVFADKDLTALRMIVSERCQFVLVRACYVPIGYHISATVYEATVPLLVRGSGVEWDGLVFTFVYVDLAVCGLCFVALFACFLLVVVVEECRPVFVALLCCIWHRFIGAILFVAFFVWLSWSLSVGFR